MEVVPDMNLIAKPVERRLALSGDKIIPIMRANGMNVTEKSEKYLVLGGFRIIQKKRRQRTVDGEKAIQTKREQLTFGGVKIIQRKRGLQRLGGGRAT